MKLIKYIKHKWGIFLAAFDNSFLFPVYATESFNFIFFVNRRLHTHYVLINAVSFCLLVTDKFYAQNPRPTDQLKKLVNVKFLSIKIKIQQILLNCARWIL